MRPILIDTNAYVSFKLGKQSVLEIFQYAESLEKNKFYMLPLQENQNSITLYF